MLGRKCNHSHNHKHNHMTATTIKHELDGHHMCAQVSLVGFTRVHNLFVGCKGFINAKYCRQTVHVDLLTPSLHQCEDSGPAQLAKAWMGVCPFYFG